LDDSFQETSMKVFLNGKILLMMEMKFQVLPGEIFFFILLDGQTDRHHTINMTTIITIAYNGEVIQPV
jgi:hypothetical protein